jgi:hypothetical protein
VEDVGFGTIVQAIGLADGNGGGELAVAEGIEEQECRDIARNGLGAESGQRAEEAVDLLKARYPVRGQAQGLNSRLKTLVGELVPTWLHAGEKPAPRFVVFGGIEMVWLPHQLYATPFKTHIQVVLYGTRA